MYSRSIRPLLSSFLVSCLLAATGAHAAPKVTTSDKGIHISNGAMGGFTMDFPVLQDAKQKKVHPLIEKKASGSSADVKYEGGASLAVSIENGDVTLSFKGVPDDVKSVKLPMLLSYEALVDGNWSVDGSAAKPFPREKPEKPHLFQGAAKSVTLTTQQEQSVSLTLPSNTFLQLTDNREWGWKIYNFQGTVAFNKDNPTLKIKVAAEGSTAPPKVIIDKFGQTVEDFPDKVRSEDELKSDVEAEKAYYASFTPPELDRYGGLPGSGEKYGLKKTSFFHVQKMNDGTRERWVMVNPDGNAFFHLGICVFTQGYNLTYIKGREGIYEWIPPNKGEWVGAYQKESNGTNVAFHVANQIRKYGKPFDPTEFTDRMIDRVRKFGFNSAGAFGIPDKASREKNNWPYTANIPLSGITVLPGIRETFDPFDEKTIAKFEENCAKITDERKNDPLIIGYFLANEPLLENLPNVIPTLPGSKWACKRKLVETLQEKYKTIEAYNAAWGAAAKGFDDLIEPGLAVKTSQAAGDMKEFTGLFLDAYFKTVHDNMKKNDPNHLLIGNRFQFGTINNEQLCRISAKYMDVITFNYYTYGLDTDFLKKVHGWSSDRPMMLTEFYWNSPSDSGVSGGVKDVRSQEERGLAYRNYIENAAQLDFIVGAEWFTLVDASPTGVAYGKYNGERPNSGLFSTADRPWKPMIAHMVKSNYQIYDLMFNKAKPFKYDDPKFAVKGSSNQVVSIPRALGPITLDGSSTNWPGTPAEQIPTGRLVQGAKSDGLEASFKLCWDDQNLYLIAQVTDKTPMKCDVNGDSLWSADGLELFFGGEKPTEGGALLFSDRQLLLGANPDGRHFFAHTPAGETPEPVKATVTPRGNDGYVLSAAIPWSSVKIKPEEGLNFKFDIAVDNSNSGTTRTAQIMWNGNSRNSTDRTAWGTARLVK